MEQRTNGGASPFAAEDLLQLGLLQEAQGKLGDAESSLRRAVVLFRSTARADRPNAMTALKSLASLLSREGRGKEAQALLAEAAAVQAGSPADARAAGSKP
jgi:Flp pilus assembly protein TadD